MFSDIILIFGFAFPLHFIVWKIFLHSKPILVLLTGELLAVLCTGFTAISVSFSSHSLTVCGRLKSPVW